jgi:hypothetical protein
MWDFFFENVGRTTPFKESGSHRICSASFGPPGVLILPGNLYFSMVQFLGILTKRPNCLTKKVLESDSLPQLKKVLEISFTIASFAKRGGGERVLMRT